MSTIHIIPILRDNYAYLVEGAARQCIIVDPGQVGPISTYVREHGLQPILILNTHHHADHVAGNAELKEEFGVTVTGPAAEMKLIPGIDKGVAEGNVIEAAGVKFEVLETPGHTKGHICFYASEANVLFAGDTLFSMGCGRLLEGTAEDLFSSLQKLKTLPPATLVYCGHEYTQANGTFAIDAEPDNADIKTRRAEVAKLRGNNLPTLPVTIETELKTNPFLRAADAKKFAELRLRKDSF